MDINQLRQYKDEQINLNPQFKEEIDDLFQLCLDEIEMGSSEQNEIDLCYNSIKQTIE